MAAIRYFFRDYLLSYRYFAPLTLYALCIALVYGVTPNPIMSSYSFTSTVLFAISAWLALGYVDVEHETQQMITSLHIGNVRNYYGYKIIPLMALTVVISVLATGYPALTGKFVRSPDAAEVEIAIACHIGLAWLGLAAGFLFTRKWFPKWYTALGGLTGFVAVSFAAAGIVRSVPAGFRWIEWLLPPMFRTMEMLNAYETAGTWQIAAGIALPFVYATLLFAVFVIGMIRKKF